MAMYGDLVNGLAFLAALPFYVTMARNSGRIDHGPWHIVCSFVFVAVASFLSYTCNNKMACMFAHGGTLVTTVLIFVYQWPHPGQNTIYNQYLWCLLICSANTSLSYTTKIVMGLSTLATAIVATIAHEKILFIVESPLTSISEMLPNFVMAVAIYSFIHYEVYVYQSSNVDVKKRRKKTFHHSVRILALFIFTYHLLGEVVRMVTKPGYAVTGGTNIIKAAAFGAIGLIAAGVFRDEMENSEKLEKLVQERTAKLLEQARHLQRVEMEAQKKEALAAAMRESMEILSHELRTPLQGIMGMTSLLLDSEDVSQKGKESLTLVMVSSRLLLTLINNMLDVRKCDANMMNGFQLQPISVADPLLDAINYCQPLGLISNVTIDLIRNQALERAVVISNRLRLQQVCINLISNAIKHSPPGKSVKVICEVRSLEQVAFLLSTSIAHGSPFESNGTNAGIANNVLLISVSDSCEGIDVNLGHRVFQKFSQLSTEKNVTGKDTSFDLQPSGTGLGLNLCLKFVQRMNGNIWASSKKDGGACFSFYVPLVEDSIVDALSLQNSRKGFDCKDGKDPSCELTSHHPFSIGLRAPSRRKFDFSSVRALVVDDAIINLKVLACMLRRFNLRSVETVDSGAKALAMLEKQQFDLVITDIQMPKMSGLQLCENICANASFDNQKPVLVGWTAEINENLDQLCRISGMVTVLHKPLTAYQLQNLLETFFAPT